MDGGKSETDTAAAQVDTEQIVQEIKSFYSADPEPPALVPNLVSALFLSEFAEHVPLLSERCHDSVKQDHLARVRNIGTTSAPWRETATCLPK